MKTIYVVIISIVIGALGFFSGMNYSQRSRTNFRQNLSGQFQGGNGNGQFTGRRQFNGRPVTGEIVSLDDKSITVKMPDGQSKIVILSDNTEINQASAASKTDLKEGSKVAVFATDNTDGSVTAQNIQLNPQLGRFQGPTPTPTQ
ncbi:hypothetical protein A2W14_03135 [Candidatus Gottesmanbacteria bacterium RBG_16_37_8]|uniref:DUF5666 domain-containing protein n=1 Tax=Candidatus Gottesmanbacteria bacterium RBG_16_37_8 TaxID=1798371 RepID=A0A1F5YUJ0_9BACT|nr:MAG: hypothetical protein A2W14_03135 [Candidatus Gottesmanbacteria bacterium RBG_16_37_8]